MANDYTVSYHSVTLRKRVYTTESNLTNARKTADSLIRDGERDVSISVFRDGKSVDIQHPAKRAANPKKRAARSVVSKAPRTTPIQKLALVGENPRARMAATELQALQKATRWRVYNAETNRLLFSAPDRTTAVEFARAYADAKNVQLSVEDNNANEARKVRK